MLADFIHSFYYSIPTLQGVVAVDGEDCRMVVQAVHELYDVHLTTPWGPEQRKATVVFIGQCSFSLFSSLCGLPLPLSLFKWTVSALSLCLSVV